MRVDELPVIRDVPAVTAAQMAEVDRLAVAEYGIAIEMLMENASRAVAHAARACLGGTVAGKRILALAGHGNNGGDALGAARHLLNWGALVTCVVAGDVRRLRPATRTQFDILNALGVRCGPPPDAALPDCELVVDGLLGYSVAGAPREAIAALVRMANRCGAPILAIDLPSGLHPDTGEPLGVAIRATFTVTLALPKVGLLATPARNLVGELLLADIAIPALAYARWGIDASAVFVNGDLVRVAR